MNRQHGAISLMVTSLLLVASLALSVASYRNIFFQIKRAQNEVISRQEHWLAEGGLECLYSQVQTTGIPTTPGNCNLEPGLTVSVTDEGGGKYRVESDYRHAKITKFLQGAGSLGTGAMQASADLYFHSSVSFYTPDPGELGKQGWECVAIRYKHRFYANDTVDNKGVIHGRLPSQGFDNEGKDCAADHLSKNMRELGKKDFVQDSSVTPFKDFFGVSSEQHDRIRDGGTFERVDGTVAGAGKPQVLENCGKKLEELIRQGKHSIWIEGGCEIKASEYEALVEATEATEDGVLIVVHDGVLSVMGAPEPEKPEKDGKDKGTEGQKSARFKGVLFHFNHDYTPTKDDWKGLNVYKHLYHSSSVVKESYQQNAAYYQHGSFAISGAQYFDTPNQSSIFFTSLDFSFDGDVVNKAREAHNKPTWMAGSWHDF